MITNSTSMTAAVATGVRRGDGEPDRRGRRNSASNNWGGTVLQPFTAQDDPFANVPALRPADDRQLLELQLRKNKPSDVRGSPTGAATHVLQEHEWISSRAT